MSRVTLEFYPNGKIRKYEIVGWFRFSDRISYNKDTEFIENEIQPKWIKLKYE